MAIPYGGDSHLKKYYFYSTVDLSSIERGWTFWCLRFYDILIRFVTTADARRVEEISTRVSRRRKLHAMGLLLKLRVRYWYDTSWSYGRIFVKIWLSSREPRWILLTSIELVVFELWRNVFLRGNFANGPRSFISRGLHQVFTVLNFSMKRAKWSRAALFTRSSRS
jgi:hypothetical protein